MCLFVRKISVSLVQATAVRNGMVVGTYQLCYALYGFIARRRAYLFIYAWSLRANIYCVDIQP